MRRGRLSKLLIAGGAVIGLTLASTTAMATEAFAIVRPPTIRLNVPSSTVIGTSATITYRINRGENQIAPGGLTCSLTGPTSSTSCGTVSSPGKHQTDGTVDLSGLRTGTYTYAVRLLLANGVNTSASGSFTVVALAGQAACLSAPAGGTFMPGGKGTTVWTCSGTAQSRGDLSKSENELGSACNTDGGQALLAPLVTTFPAAITWTCF